MTDRSERTIPFLRPEPPKLSQLTRELAEIEASGVYTNFGPVSRATEAAIVDQLFGGVGAALLVNNATLGLIIAMRAAVALDDRRRYALMPSFTFAAAAQAALWAGLTPLLCDIDPETWTSSPDAEEELVARYGDEIGCIVPYACFGNDIDLDRYVNLADHLGAALVVDAAASLGSYDRRGRHFGTGFDRAIVYSMHATKTYSTAEAGLVYSGDTGLIDRLRAMANFGFAQPRTASMPGLNAKLPEYGALLVRERLRALPEVVAHRSALAARYRERLVAFQSQRTLGTVTAYQFMPVLVPEQLRASRDQIVREMAAAGVGLAHYFSPHLAEQPYFARTAVCGPLPVTEDVAARALSLPVADSMTLDDVDFVADKLLSLR